LGFSLLNKNGVYFVRVSSPISFPCVVRHYRHACIGFHCLWCAESSSIVCDHTASFCLVIYRTSPFIFENRFFFPNRALCHSPPYPLVLFTSAFHFSALSSSFVSSPASTLLRNIYNIFSVSDQAGCCPDPGEPFAGPGVPPAVFVDLAALRHEPTPALDPRDRHSSGPPRNKVQHFKTHCSLKTSSADGGC